MKKINHLLFVLSSISMLITGCGSNAKTLEPSFANYTEDDIVSKDLFNALVENKDKELGFADIQYNRTSYQIESSQTLITTTTHKYEKGNIVTKMTERFNTAKYYNQRNSVILYDTDRNNKVEKNDGVLNLSVRENWVYQVYNQQIVIADKNNKLYEVIQDLNTVETFGGYVAASHAISPKYITNYANEHYEMLSSFVLEDAPLICYAKKKLFTIGISYKEKEIPNPDNYYSETLTVKAVCQIVANKNNVVINVRYDTTSVRENFSDTYITANNVDYSKETITKSFSKVIRLNVGGTVLGDSVDVSKYSLGNVNY